ncbi:hypothetical protein OF83DRAFT_1124344 [Amylostereum chailletii]|nr:hypothetical protein OF83DRAFT_1124344 [Amylostereum chailletii]
MASSDMDVEEGEVEDSLEAQQAPADPEEGQIAFVIPLSPSQPLPDAVIAKCRQIIMPVLLKNVQREGMPVSQELLDKAASMFTEERCRELLAHAHKTRQQMDARSTRIGQPNTTFPTMDNFTFLPSRPPSPITKRAREDDADSSELQGREKRSRFDSGPTNIVQPPVRTSTVRAGNGVAVSPGRATSIQPQCKAPSVDPDSPMAALVDDTSSHPQSKDSKVAMGSPQADTSVPDVIQEAVSITPLSGAPTSAAQRSLDIDPSPPIPPPGGLNSTLSPPSLAEASASPAGHPTTAQEGAVPADISIGPTKYVQDAWEPPDDTMGIPAFTRSSPAPPAPVAEPASLAPPVPPAQPPPPSQPFVSLVPGLWALHPGVSTPDIIDISVEVDEATAAAIQRWIRRWEYFDPSARHVVVRLLCIPLAQVQELNAQIGGQNPMPSPAQIATSMAQFQTIWPLPNGSLIVQLNLNDGGKTWFAPALTPNTPLDVSEAIQPGMNSLRMIQLADMSTYVFVLHADEPAKEDLAALDEHRVACKGFADDGWAVTNSEFAFPLSG